MKYLVCFLVVVIALVHAQPSPEKLAKLKKAKDVCKPKTGATDDDIGKLMQHEIPDTRTAHCFVACMNKELGIMTADNKFDVDRIKSMAGPLKEKDEGKYNLAMKIIDTCAVEVAKETDECDMAKTAMHCTKREAEAANIMMTETGTM